MDRSGRETELDEALGTDAKPMPGANVKGSPESIPVVRRSPNDNRCERDHGIHLELTQTTKFAAQREAGTVLVLDTQPGLVAVSVADRYCGQTLRAENQMADQGINLKLEAERLSSSANRLLVVATQLAQIAGHSPVALDVARRLIAAATDTSNSAARFVTSPEINLKLDAERLSTTSRSLLDIARPLAQIAAENPSSAVHAEDILSIAQDISNSAVRLVGQ